MNSIPQQEVAKATAKVNCNHTYNIIQFCGEKTFSNNTFWRLNFIFELLIFYILN
jgi:hypothetical protein